MGTIVMFIPCRLIWSVKIPWTKKLALASTLCLSILTIICTIVNITGIYTSVHVKSMDFVWATYWQFIAAEIALTMTAATAFRALFVSRSAVEHRHAPGVQDHSSKESLYGRSQRLLRSVFSTRFWDFLRSRGPPQRLGDGNSDWNGAPVELRQHIPRATLTGMRTFIRGHSNSRMNGESQIMQSVGHEEFEDGWPLSGITEAPRNVGHRYIGKGE